MAKPFGILLEFPFASDVYWGFPVLPVFIALCSIYKTGYHETLHI